MTKNLITLSFLAPIALAGAVAPAHAASDEWSAGAIEYQQACASCHGVKGTGDGPLAHFMNVKVADLTTIKARHNGQFPFRDMMEMVDGRSPEAQIGPHGRQMPVWGNRFMLESGTGDKKADEINTLGKTAALVYYIYSIQK